MNKRGFIAMLCGLFGMAAFGQSSTTIGHLEEVHNWKKSPFWLTASNSFEEPRYYSPSTLVSVEICSHCGILRVNKAYAGFERLSEIPKESEVQR